MGQFDDIDFGTTEEIKSSDGYVEITAPSELSVEDEVNNSLFITRGFHTQFHKNEYVVGMVERNIQVKLLRTARLLLPFLSRTSDKDLVSNRPKVKAALKGDVYHKSKTLRSINLGEINNLGKTKVEFPDYLKTMAFQLGQTIGLIEGV